MIPSTANQEVHAHAGHAFKRFEDSDAWQVARQLTNLIYDLSRGEQFSRDFGLRDQIRRAAVSVMSNISEGSEHGSNREYVRYLFIARGSVGEVRSQLYVAVDQGYMSADQFKEAHALCVRQSQLIWGLIQFLRRSAKGLEKLGLGLAMLISGVLPSAAIT